MKKTGPIPQTELHRHLDASLRLTTLHELAQKKSILPQSTSLEAFSREFILITQQPDLRSVLARFSLFQKVLDTPEALERVAYEAVEDCHREGTRIAELRFSPHFVAEYSKLGFDLILSSFEAGIHRACRKLEYDPIQVGLICILTRDYGVESAHEAMEFYLIHKDRFVGVDLAGNEDEFPCRIFEPVFKRLHLAHPNSTITIHSGEGSGPENVWEAIDLLQAKRIGHGIRSIEDPKLVTHLREKNICLEVCPTSNYITKTVEALSKHPLRAFLEQNVACSINTDDPGIFAVTLKNEYEAAAQKIGLTTGQLQTCQRNAFEHSFLNQ